MQQHIIESICVNCQKKFNARKDLKRHTKVDKVQRCEECGKWFSSKKECRFCTALHCRTHKKNTNDDEELDILGIDLLVYLVDIMHIFFRGASAACIFFSGGPKPPLIKFVIFRQEKTCPPEEEKSTPLKKKKRPP